MSIPEKAQDFESRLRFKQFNKFMLMLWRLGLGKWVNGLPEVGGRIMVITHRGRKPDKIYHTPVNYAEIDGDIYCQAGHGQPGGLVPKRKSQPRG